MSGAEAVAVLGVISSIIAIIDGTKQVYDAASNVSGLPEAFSEVANRIPIVRNILDLAKGYIGDEHVDEQCQSCSVVKPVVDACEMKAQRLDEIFKKVVPRDGASRKERYIAAVKTWGKGNQVEILMKGMLEDVQLLANHHGMDTAIQSQLEQVAKAISDLSAFPLSVPDHLLQDTTFSNTQYGTGLTQTNYNSKGDQYNISGGKMNKYTAHSMSFGADGKD
jgi:hypothetical protein